MSTKSNARHVKSRSAAKQSAKGRKPRHLPWSFVVAIILLALTAIGVLLFFLSLSDQEPYPATYQSALAALQRQGISAVIAPDIATDYASGNYTLRELAKRYPGFEQDIRAADKALRDSEQDVLLIVNGEPITRTDFQAQSSLLPETYRDALSDEQILEEMTNERLLLQEAARRSLAVTEGEIEAAYDDLLVKGNLTEQQLEENINSYGLSTDNLRTLLRRQLLLNKLFAETIEKDLNVSDADVRRFYDDNKESLRAPGTVTVRHILIALGATVDDAAANETINKVRAEYLAGADFCALVTNYTNDAGSKRSCGEYTFGQDYMVKPFEEASFALRPGETAIVKTIFGYHLILKMNETAGVEVPYARAAPLIRDQLAAAKRLDAYRAFIQELRDKATITVPSQPLEQEVTAAPPGVVPLLNESYGNISIETQSPSTAPPSVPAASSATVTIAPKNVTNETAPPKTNTTQAATQPSVAPSTAVPAEKTAPPAPTPSVPGDLAAFARCLSSAGAKLFIASWDSVSRQETQKFGVAIKELAVTDCAAAPCDGIEAYPTWTFKNEKILGTLSWTELSSRTGCVLQ